MKVAKNGPLPVDQEAAALEEQRRAEQRNNPELQRGMASARSQATDNLRNVMNDAIAAVKIATPDRDSTYNTRQRYERNYERMRQAVRQVVLATSAAVDVPKYLPPPEMGEQVERMGPEHFPVDLGQYNERGARPTGITPNFADTESAAHRGWLNLQGETK